MHNTNIIVCDDNTPFLKVMLKLLSQYAVLYNANVIGFSNGKELLEHCCSNKFDVIYMDIEIGSENGMALAKTIKNMNPNALIIYMSSFSIYYADMVNAEPFRFISKDMSNIQKFEKEVADALEAAMRRINGKDMFSFTFDRKQHSIELGNVKYFHSIARTIHIVGDIGKPNYYYGKMDELQKELERIDGSFVRISKSYIVNMKYAMLSGKSKVVVDGKEFSVTTKYAAEFRKRYNDYWI